MKYGEIYWVDLPDRGGREQRGRRPAITWQDTIRFPTATILVIPLTSQVSALSIPSTYLVTKSPMNGLANDSVALTFQLGAADVRRIGSRLGRLDDADLAAIQQLAKELQLLP